MTQQVEPSWHSLQDCQAVVLPRLSLQDCQAVVPPRHSLPGDSATRLGGGTAQCQTTGDGTARTLKTQGFKF